MVNLSFKELAKYKNEEGFIELTHLLTSKVEVEREVRGNDKRDKRWFKTNDGKAMFKSNAPEQLNAHWSELICCECAGQVGIETAQYDLAKYNGQQGIVTKDICKPGEELLTINDLIGNGPTNPEYPDNTDIYFVFDALEEKLRVDGYEEDVIDECMLSLRKQLLFDIYVMETDRHTENISFIIGKDEKTGKQTIRLAPMYDTEAALAIYDDEEHMKKVWSSMIVTANVTNMQEPKICVIPEPDEDDFATDDLKDPKSFLESLQSQVSLGNMYSTKSEEIWKTTLDFLVEDRRAFTFLEEQLSKMDIKKAIENVEEKNSCKIPEGVINMAVACFEDRKRAISYELGLDIEIKQKTPKELT